MSQCSLLWVAAELAACYANSAAGMAISEPRSLTSYADAKQSIAPVCHRALGVKSPVCSCRLQNGMDCAYCAYTKSSIWLCVSWHRHACSTPHGQRKPYVHSGLVAGRCVHAVEGPLSHTRVHIPMCTHSGRTLHLPVSRHRPSAARLQCGLGGRAGILQIRDSMIRKTAHTLKTMNTLGCQTRAPN